MTSDKNLIDRIAAGEGDAFATFIAPHRGELLRFAARQVGGDSQLAEDVLQQALLNSYRALSTGFRPQSPRAWLFTIVRNEAANTRRSMQTSERLDARDRADQQPPLSERVEQGEWMDWLMGAIAELPQRQRDVLVGHAFEGRSHRELAAREQTTVLAVKTLLYRARRHLNELRPESLLSVLYFARGRLAGLKASLGLGGQAPAAATITSTVLLAVHAPGVGSVLAAGPPAHTGGTPAPARASHHASGPASRHGSPQSPGRIRHEAKHAITACLHGKPLTHHYSPSALRYAAHHLATD